MDIGFRKAEISDAELLIGIYDSSFYDDYVRYGECPAYGRTREMMEQSIIDYPKFVISCDGIPVGSISCKETESGVYGIGCLCVIPEYQRRGIGTSAVEYVKAYYSNWKKFTLVTPVDKGENVRFYTEKSGFMIGSIETDGNVAVYRFVLENK